MNAGTGISSKTAMVSAPRLGMTDIGSVGPNVGLLPDLFNSSS
jgi:hypothetical protein